MVTWKVTAMIPALHQIHLKMKNSRRSGHIQSKSIISALTPSTLHERGTFRMNCQFMERHAKAAPSWQEAVHQLGVKDIRQAWMPGLLPCVNLRWWQVTGVT
jgi:hypothetical protein